MASSKINSTILETILDHKATEVAAAKRRISQRELEQQFGDLAERRQFQAAMRETILRKQPAVIAEIKKASPSKGLIRADFDPAAHAQDYAINGATCLSILTDQKFFQGSNDFLQQAKAACELPVLRKDFMIDTYQIAESKALGADCILLIVAAMEQQQLEELAAYANTIDLDVLVEIHNRDELERALRLSTDLIGINNRNLHTFETALQTTLDLLPHIPSDKLLITESGIDSVEDIQKMKAAGVYGFLIGEACMRAEHPGARLKQLIAD